MRNRVRYLGMLAEKSVTQANCNPLGYILVLGVIVAGVSYHFRDAILNAIKDGVMLLGIAFLIYGAIHIAGHVRERRRASYAELRAQAIERHKAQGDGAPEDQHLDPVLEAERVVSQAFQGLGPDPTQDGSRRVG